MTRVSQEELYNDKDVITQILKLKDTVNDYAGGIIENIDVSGNDLVIDWEDGTSISLPLPDPVTGISSVTGNVSGGNLTITFYFSNGTTHSFTCPLAGMASEAYVDAKDAQNVKLTGAQSVAGVKTFTDSPVVPTTPGTTVSAVNQDWAENAAYLDDTVNNLVHKEGNEIIKGEKTFNTTYTRYTGLNTTGWVYFYDVYDSNSTLLSQKLTESTVNELTVGERAVLGTDWASLILVFDKTTKAVQLKVQKSVGGVYTETVVATL